MASDFREISEEYQRRTDEIEAKKEEKQRRRLEKQRLDNLKKRNKLIEKLIAPAILLFTVLLSFLLMFLN